MKNNRISSIARSKLLRRGLLAVFFLVCVALLSWSGSRVSSQTSTPAPPPQAQNETKSAARLISDAKRAGRDFPTVEPFNRQTRSAAADPARRRAVTAGSLLQLRPNALTDLTNRNAQTLTLRLPTFARPPVELELVQVNLFASNFNVVTSDSNDHPVPYDRGVHYWGVIKGIENSLAAISVFKDEVIGFYSSEKDGNFVLGKLAGNNPARDHILYAEKDLTSTMPVSCDMPDDNTALPPQQFDTSTAAPVRCVRVFIEADHDLFLNKGSVNATVNYVTGVFNQSALLFSNEGIPMSISQIFVWTSPSPYTGGDSFTQLAQFQSTRTSFNGDIAHLVDLQNQGGVAAGFNGFCNPNRSQSQCYSGIFPTYSDVPTYSWTVEVFTHEMGHLFGSRHTHACVWNGNGTAIDGCGQQAGHFEGSCPIGPIPGDGGTVMSYCHLNSVGINFSKGFGPQPGNVIRSRFNSASCLGTCGDPAIAFSQSAYTASETALDPIAEPVLVVNVTRTGNLSGTSTVNYQTIDDPAAVPCNPAVAPQPAQPTAYARCDYATTIDTLTFAPGESQKTFRIPLVNDGYVEQPETFTITLSNPQGAVVGALGSATITINSDDTVGTNPINNHQFFVRQHYLDFLAREPDSGGFNAWLSVLNNCPNPFNFDPNSSSAGCDRITVSSSFFRSQEFELKGLYIYKFYRVAFHDPPNSLPAYSDISRDMRLVTGQTSAEVFAKRAAFAEAFVQRTRFSNMYGGLSNSAYVSALLNPYGLAAITTTDPANPDTGGQVVLTHSELVTRLNNLTMTRGQVLRAIVQSQEVHAVEFNGAFVAMQYYGYLRRTPEESGYNAWLNYLNANPTDFRTMVQGFLYSQEYALRFGPS